PRSAPASRRSSCHARTSLTSRTSRPRRGRRSASCSRTQPTRCSTRPSTAPAGGARAGRGRASGRRLCRPERAEEGPAGALVRAGLEAAEKLELTPSVEEERRPEDEPLAGAGVADLVLPGASAGDDHRRAPLDPAVELRGDLLGRAIQGGHGLRPEARLVAAREAEDRDADEVGATRANADVRAAPPDVPG